MDADTAPHTWHRFVAIGDSFTEGLCDPAPGAGADGPYRGWADRLAESLAAGAARAGHGLEYANLAVRGRLLRGILDEQLPLALASGADLFSLAAGGNDILRPRADVDALAAAVDDAVAALRAGGATVLLTTGFDPQELPFVRLVRGRAAAYNLALWAIAHRHGALVLDLWTMRALYDRRLWAPDRIHLSSEGHRRVALQAEHELARAGAPVGGADPGEWAVPLSPAPPGRRLDALGADAAWARTHLAPWVRRRMTGRSSGDGRTAKRPVPLPLDAPAR